MADEQRSSGNNQWSMVRLPPPFRTAETHFYSFFSGSDLHIYRGDTPGIKQTGFTLVSTGCVIREIPTTNDDLPPRATSSAVSFTSSVNRCWTSNGP